MFMACSRSQNVSLKGYTVLCCGSLLKTNFYFCKNPLGLTAANMNTTYQAPERNEHSNYENQAHFLHAIERGPAPPGAILLMTALQQNMLSIETQ